MFSSQSGPSFVVHWKALFTCFLISLRYCIPCVISIKVCSVCFRAIAPYLATGVLIPIIFLPEPLVSFFKVCLGTKATLLDVTAYFFLQWFCLYVKTVVFGWLSPRQFHGMTLWDRFAQSHTEHNHLSNLSNRFRHGALHNPQTCSPLSSIVHTTRGSDFD